MLAVDLILIKIIYFTNRNFRATICFRGILDPVKSGAHRAVPNKSRKRTTETAVRPGVPPWGCERYGEITPTTVSTMLVR